MKYGTESKTKARSINKESELSVFLQKLSVLKYGCVALPRKQKPQDTKVLSLLFWGGSCLLEHGTGSWCRHECLGHLFVWHSAQQAPHGPLCFAEENIVPPYWCRLGKVGLYRKWSLRQAGGFFMWVEQIHLPWGETQCWHLHVHPSIRCLLQAPPRHVGISLSSVPSPGTMVFPQCRSFTAALAMFQGFLHWGVWSGGCYLFKRDKAALALLWNTTRAGCYFVKQQPG